MRINRLELAAFGRFSDYCLDLSDGFQVLVGDNEAGKSTLMAFLRLMFYGKVERTQALERNLRKKYVPWDSSVMEGAVEFASEGRCLRLQKTFGDTPGKDRISLLDMDSGDSVSLRRDEEVGSRYFGLDAAGFERTCFIGRIGAVTTDGKTDVVAERLMANLAQSGDMQISGQLAADRLTSARETLISKSGKKGQLVQLQQELDALQDEKAQTELMLQQQEHLQRQYLETQERLARKNRVEQMLAGLHATQKIDALEQLEQKLEQRSAVIQDLERKGLCAEALPPLVQKLKELSFDCRAAATAYDNLLSSSDGETSARQVSQDDFQRAELLEHQISLSTALLDGWRSSLLPALEDSLSKQQADADTRKALAACQDELVELEAARLQHDELMKQESRAQQALDELENDYAAQKAVLENHLNNSRTSWTYLKDVLNEQSAKGRKRGRILAVATCTLIVAAVMALYCLFGERLLLFTFLLAALPPLFYHIRWSARGQAGDAADYRKMHDVAQQRIQDAEQKLQEFQDAYNTSHIELTRNLERIRRQMEETAPQAAQSEACRHNLTELRESEMQAAAELNASKLILSRQADLLHIAAEAAADAGLPVFEIPSRPREISSEHTSELEIFLDAIKKSHAELLQAHQADNTEVLRSHYLQYSADQKNRSAIGRAEENRYKLETAYLEAASFSDTVSDLEQAEQVLLSLRQTASRLDELQMQIRHMAAGAGLPENPTREQIAQRKTALQPVAAAWSAQSDPEEATLRLELADLSSADLMHTLQSLQQKLQTPAHTPQQLEREIAEKTAQLEQMEVYEQSLSLAHRVMLESVEEMRSTFGPELNRKTGEILSALTAGRYSEVLVSEDYTIRIRSGLHYREYPYLSSGTIDQAYLALRLAISDLLSSGSEPLPVILDDVLMQYDDSRAKQCLTFLQSYAAARPGRQIILFTCHGHIAAQAQAQRIACRTLLQAQSV